MKFSLCVSCQWIPLPWLKLHLSLKDLLSLLHLHSATKKFTWSKASAANRLLLVVGWSCRRALLSSIPQLQSWLFVVQQFSCMIIFFTFTVCSWVFTVQSAANILVKNTAKPFLCLRISTFAQATLSWIPRDIIRNNSIVFSLQPVLWCQRGSPEPSLCYLGAHWYIPSSSS